MSEPEHQNAPTSHPRLSVAERKERGRALRARIPRTSFGDWQPAADRVDVVAQLAEQEATRLPDLVPVRHERMAASPFAFFRGAAKVFAADLAPMPRSGLTVQLCGDAHLSNFGSFASPERTLVFDINDFDETLPGPFEWDLERLAASVEIAGRGNGFEAKQRERIQLDLVATYATVMRTFSTMSYLDIWYAKLYYLRDRVGLGLESLEGHEGSGERCRREGPEQGPPQGLQEADDHRRRPTPVPE